MSQTATTSVPPKGIGSVEFWKDLGKGAFLAGLTNLLLGLYPILSDGQMPTHADFVFMLRTTLAIIIAYFIKNLNTNNVGEMFSKDKAIVRVDAKELDELKKQATEVTDQTKTT